MRVIISIFILFTFNSVDAQTLLKITYKEKKSNSASMRFVSVSDSTTQFQFIESDNTEGNPVSKMQNKKLLHHSDFSILDSASSWNVVVFPKNLECLIKSDFLTGEYTIVKETKIILGYPCRKAIVNKGKNNEIEVWFTDSIQNYFSKSYAYTAPGVVLEIKQKLTNFTRIHIAEKIEFEKGEIIFPNETAILMDYNWSKYTKGKQKLSYFNINNKAVISKRDDIKYPL